MQHFKNAQSEACEYLIIIIIIIKVKFCKLS